MVSGADWLRTLGFVLFNYEKLCIRFRHQGKKITLNVEREKTSLKMINTKAVEKFFMKNTHGLVGHLSTTQSTPSPIQNILLKFEDVFNEQRHCHLN